MLYARYLEKQCLKIQSCCCCYSQGRLSFMVIFFTFKLQKFCDICGMVPKVSYWEGSRVFRAIEAERLCWSRLSTLLLYFCNNNFATPRTNTNNFPASHPLPVFFTVHLFKSNRNSILDLVPGKLSWRYHNAIAGQTAGPNRLTFFEGTLGLEYSEIMEICVRLLGKELTELNDDLVNFQCLNLETIL